MKRRQLMATTTGLVAAGGAGCSSIVGRREAGRELGGVTLLNDGSSTNEFGVRIERDGERVHESEYSVDGDSFVSVGCDWSDSTGTYVIAARTASSDWVDQTVSAETPNGAFRSVTIAYDGGTFDFTTGLNCDFGCE